MVKSSLDIVSETVNVWVVVPSLPVTLRKAVPTTTLVATEIVAVEVAVPSTGAVTLEGLYDAVTPGVAAEVDRATPWLNPLIEVTETVAVPDPPIGIVRELGSTDTEKPVGATRTLTS
jgi:hypothetical protein